MRGFWISSRGGSVESREQKVRRLTEFSFSVRNPGNVVPHSQHFGDEFTMCESAALELGCVVNDIRHVIVCGHSDCKAMNLLYALRDEEFASQVRFFAALYTYIYTHTYTVWGKSSGQLSQKIYGLMEKCFE